MRLVSASSLPMSQVLAACTALNEAGWGGRAPPSARLPTATELAQGERELLFLQWRGCLTAMATLVRARVCDGVRSSLSNVISLPRGAGLRRFDEPRGELVEVPGVFIGGGGLTVHALVLNELQRLGEHGQAPHVEWIDAFPRLTQLPEREGAECEIQSLLDDVGFEPFVLGSPSSYYSERRELLLECCLITGTEAVDPEAAIHLPGSASLQAAIVQVTFTRVFGWAPPIVTTAPRRAVEPAQEQRYVQDFSPSSCALWVSAGANPDAALAWLRRELAGAVRHRPRKAVMINVANHPANLALIEALEAWGCVPIGILPRFNGRPHRLCWSALHPEEVHQLPVPRLAPRLADPPLADVLDRVVQRRATTELAAALLTD